MVEYRCAALHYDREKKKNGEIIIVMVYGWIWIALVVLCAALAVLTKKNMFISIAVGALIPLIMDICKAGLIFQAIVFVAVTLICLIIVGKRAATTSTDGIDSVVGTRCVVEERIDGEAGCGQVLVNGQSWSARAVDETDVYEAGEVLKVVAVEGVKLICMK